MPWLTESSEWAMWLFQRGLGLCYLLAFLVALHQFVPLQGESGLEPVTAWAGKKNFRSSPSIFHLHYSDAFFRVMAGLGLGLSLLATLGIADAGPIALSMTVWFLLWASYLSIVNIGGTFYGFGWESKLLDAGFLAIFLGPYWLQKPLVLVFLVRFLLFRVELGAGLIKMRGDRCWRDLSCMRYHHETQPIPNPLSWYFHHAPGWWHKVETFGNHVIQLGVVWLIFFPQPIASIAGVLIISSQLWLVQSGNYSWLNLLTICVACSTLGDDFLQGVGVPRASSVAPLPWGPTMAQSPPPNWLHYLDFALLALVAVLSIPVVNNLLSPKQRMNKSFNPFHLVGSYGAFGSVTRERHEIIIEGTRDDDPCETAEFLEYEMKAKPGLAARRPRQIAPYHLRLDWQLWFVPLRPSVPPRWLLRFVQKLLENDAQTLSLIANNPFPDCPPRFIRISLYHYRFTNPQERRSTGKWWVRTYLDEYLAPVSRSQLEKLL